jgi:hypothetical protein
MQPVYSKWVRKTMVMEAWVVVVILVEFVVMKMVVVLEEER